jgi:hypothetical protein
LYGHPAISSTLPIMSSAELVPLCPPPYERNLHSYSVKGLVRFGAAEGKAWIIRYFSYLVRLVWAP